MGSTSWLAINSALETVFAITTDLGSRFQLIFCQGMSWQDTLFLPSLFLLMHGFDFPHGSNSAEIAYNGPRYTILTPNFSAQELAKRLAAHDTNDQFIGPIHAPSWKLWLYIKKGSFNSLHFQWVEGGLHPAGYRRRTVTAFKIKWHDACVDQVVTIPEAITALALITSAIIGEDATRRLGLDGRLPQSPRLSSSLSPPGVYEPHSPLHSDPPWQ